MLIVSSFHSSSGVEMNDIPEDIRLTAETTVRRLSVDAIMQPDIEVIARAILAERQACEKIARGRSLGRRRMMDRYEASGDHSAFLLCSGRLTEAEEIADLIADRSKFSSGSPSLPGSAA